MIHAAELQQAARANLVHSRLRLTGENALVIQATLVERGKVFKVEAKVGFVCDAGT